MPAALVVLAAAACGGGEGVTVPSGGPPRPQVAELWIENRTRSPARAPADTISESGGRRLVAGGRWSDGRAIQPLEVVWSSSDTTVLAVQADAGGADVAGRGAGAARIVVTVGAANASVAFAVTREPVAQVAIVPATSTASLELDSVLVRGTRRYRTHLTNAAQRRIGDRPIRWTTSDSAVATVTDDGTVVGRRVGGVTLSAEVEGITRQIPLVIRPPLAAGIAFTYAPESVLLRRTDSVRAVLLDSAGQPMAVQPRLVVEPGSDGGAADVSARPETVRGAWPGATMLVASGDGLEVRRPLVVRPVPVLRVETLPGGLTLATGTSVGLRAAGTDADGENVFGRRFAYASDDPAVATVTAEGVVEAGAPGATVVQVRSDTATLRVPVRVVAPDAFGIAHWWLTAPPPGAEDALRRATQSWARAIVGDLPDADLALPASACVEGTPRTELVVDDVLVLVRADSIDGRRGTLAYAGPCVYRGEGGGTVVGVVVLDTADVGWLAADDRLYDVLRHELGHVLGIGTLWARESLGLVTRAGDAWRFVGARANAVATWWNVAAPEGGVALGAAGGEGSGHWSEATFGPELMTPVLNAGRNPLSLLSIEALGDLGYLVSAAAAEAPPGATPRASRAAVPLGGDGRGPFERVLRPRWRVDGAGRVTEVAPGARR